MNDRIYNMRDMSGRMVDAAYAADTASLPEVLLGNRWTTESPIQQPSNSGGPAWLPLAAYGTGLALGNSGRQWGIADALTPNVNSIPMEGPMRFAGRGIPKVLYDWEIPGKDAPDDWVPALPNPVEVAPAPKFPDIISIRPKRPPTSIWETSPDGGPRRGSRKPHYRIPYAPDKNVDLRTDWEAWIDSFKEDWKAK